MLNILELQGKIKWIQRATFQYPRFLLDKPLTTYYLYSHNIIILLWKIFQ